MPAISAGCLRVVKAHALIVLCTLNCALAAGVDEEPRQCENDIDYDDVTDFVTSFVQRNLQVHVRSLREEQVAQEESDEDDEEDSDDAAEGSPATAVEEDDRPPIEVATVIDSSYAPVVRTFFRSLAAHHKAGEVRLHVLADRLSVTERSTLTQAAREAGLIARILEPRSQGPEHIAAASRLPLQLPSLLTDLRRAIWLDADVVVRKHLRELWSGAACGAGWNSANGPGVCGRHTASLQPSKTSRSRQLNAGVMLLDLDVLRSHQFDAKMRHLLRSTCPDDTGWAFDAYCLGSSVELDKRYNVWPADIQQADGIIDPAIVHFRGPAKPWDCEAVKTLDKSVLRFWAEYNEGRPCLAGRQSRTAGTQGGAASPCPAGGAGLLESSATAGCNLASGASLWGWNMSVPVS
eukprot:TRINITY_DN41328_c0_g2_i1.p1 TRINITY_DN41328_c0_g2~~TRINITY_DN41328_c0_g2_i1.p1  ORF type:complete len:407 (+),score=84.94 TRINITY_DN41328_c0_g2_i1:74-1294(+)